MKPMIEKDGGLIVTISYNRNNQDYKKEIQVIKNRITDAYLKIEELKTDSINNTITISVPELTDSLLFTQLISFTGDFSIYRSYDNKDIILELYRANRELKIINDSLRKEKTRYNDIHENENQEISLLEKIKANENQLKDSLKNNNPLLSILTPNISTYSGEFIEGPKIGYANKKDTSLIAEYLRTDKVKSLFEKDGEFLWSLNPINYANDDDIYELYAVKLARNSSMLHINKYIKSCHVETNKYNNGNSVSITLDKEGTEKFSVLTRDNVNKFLPIVMDKRVIICPKVMSQITEGKIQISTGSYGNKYEHNVFRSLLKNYYEFHHTKINNIKVVPSKK